jgi:effector protein SdbA
LIKISSVFNLSFLTKRRTMSLSNPKDKAYVDDLITEIGLLHSGTSLIEKCKNKHFAWDEIHLKGKEHLDEELRQYLEHQLQSKYGREEKQNSQTKLSFYSLETYDNAVLDSVSLSSENEESKPMHERKFIITCLANGQNYMRWMKDFSYSSKQIGCTVIGFNYRGIDFSRGLVWTEKNMIDDALAQVRMLLAQGAKPENIGLEGMCLGGAVATLAVAQLHDENIKVKLYNERSFRSIARALAGVIFPGVKSNPFNPLNWLRYVLGGLIYLVVTPFIMISCWHMDVGSRWDAIPEEDKNYSTVRNFEDPNGDAPVEDGVIEDSWASIGSLVDEKRANACKKQHKGKTLSVDEQHLLDDKKEAHYFKVNPAFDHEKKAPHVLARRNLIQSSADNIRPMHMHDHMVVSFQHMFFKSPKTVSVHNVHFSHASNQELIHHAVPV